MSLDPAAIFHNLDLKGRHRVVVALSGGSDSVALLLLIREFLKQSGSIVRLHAVTVDHALRPESAREAEAVAARCRALAVDHRTLRWEGPKPSAGVIAAARDARYDLLARAADDIGADIVLTGHTLDDQAETVAMRAGRGSGAGMAGMAFATLFDGRIWLVRPLLGMRRQALRDYLNARGEGWIDDPSNLNHAFERVRVRAGLSDPEIEKLAVDAAGAGRERQELSAAAASLIGHFGSMPAPGLFRLDPEFLRGAYPGDGNRGDSEAAAHAMRALLATAGGTPYLPDRERTVALVGRLAAGEPLRATLSRAAVEAGSNGIWIRREARNLPTPSQAGRAQLWDGRWRIAAEGEAAGLAVGPLGAERASDFAAPVVGIPQRLVRAALAVEPAVYNGEEFVGIAGRPETLARGVSAVAVACPFARFLPGFDLALAAAVRRLICAGDLPASPWKHHIAPGP